MGNRTQIFSITNNSKTSRLPPGSSAWRLEQRFSFTLLSRKYICWRDERSPCPYLSDRNGESDILRQLNVSGIRYMTNTKREVKLRVRMKIISMTHIHTSGRTKHLTSARSTKHAHLGVKLIVRKQQQQRPKPASTSCSPPTSSRSGRARHITCLPAND